MGFTNIRLAREEAVAIVSVCRPDKLNALNDATLEELTDAFTGLRDDASVRAVILTGGEAKRPAFVAGADIAELAQQTPLEAKQRSHVGQGLCDLIEKRHNAVWRFIEDVCSGVGSHHLEPRHALRPFSRQKALKTEPCRGQSRADKRCGQSIRSRYGYDADLRIYRRRYQSVSRIGNSRRARI